MYAERRGDTQTHMKGSERYRYKFSSKRNKNLKEESKDVGY
jgi:hypothetical protein